MFIQKKVSLCREQFQINRKSSQSQCASLIDEMQIQLPPVPVGDRFLLLPGKIETSDNSKPYILTITPQDILGCYPKWTTEEVNSENIRMGAQYVCYKEVGQMTQCSSIFSIYCLLPLVRKLNRNGQQIDSRQRVLEEAHSENTNWYQMSHEHEGEEFENCG